NTSIVDHQVRYAQLFKDLIEHTINIALLSHVSRYNDRFSSGLLDAPGGLARTLFILKIIHRHLVPIESQCLGYSPSDSATRTRDQGDFSFLRVADVVSGARHRRNRPFRHYSLSFRLILI